MVPLVIAALQFNPVFAVTCSTSNFFFFLPPWYEFLSLAPDSSGVCTVQNFTFPTDLLPVGLAILDDLIRLAGFAAIISIIVAGVSYITASGNPEKAASARRRIYNSLIGLAIAFVAAGVVAFIGNSIK
jgi:hypothetical protein